MPNMNGLVFLEKIMRYRPTPVIMMSNLTSLGAPATLEALELGAYDCVAKPMLHKSEAVQELVDMVKAAAGSPVRPLSDRQPTPSIRVSTTVSGYAPGERIVAIGASTGGVEALLAILSSFPANCPPTVITQHMPPTFTKSFAERLDRLCAPHISEAVDGAPLAAGQVYLAPGGADHLEVITKGGVRRCRLREGNIVNGHCPSVDVLFESVSRTAGSEAVGVILTGMGRDGASGLLSLRWSGARTIGQDAATCVVYGMPKAAAEIGATEKELPLEKIGREILNVTALRQEGIRICRSSST
jgi:two-component system, chemotaxis family, protein-glutamate methylesterase/glutaminase